jgi:F-type H+-transporting ATPase subunit epsilon
MAGTFRFELVTPERMALSQDVNEVVVPGLEGDFTVLPGHAPVVSALRPGILDVTLSDQRTTRIFVKGGFAEVDAEHLTVLAERALEVAAMDATMIAAELASAEADLAAATDDMGRLAAASALVQLKRLQGQPSG